MAQAVDELRDRVLLVVRRKDHAELHRGEYRIRDSVASHAAGPVGS
jgi:hypothetical protein